MLSMLRALWEQVTADLRGVAVTFRGSSEQGAIEARFLYEGEVGDVQAECVSMAETYCIADFPPEVSVAFRSGTRRGTRSAAGRALGVPALGVRGLTDRSCRVQATNLGSS